MKYFLSTAVFVLLCYSCFGSIITEDVVLYFDHDSHELSPESINALNVLIDSQGLSGDYVLQITGHTNTDGSAEYNEELSARRSQSVKAFLKAKGACDACLLVQSKGEHIPLVTYDNADAKKKNRRVHVVYTRYEFESVDELLEEMGKENENHFELPADQARTVRTEKGIEIQIPSDAFVDAHGNAVTGAVSLEVTDAVDLFSFLTEGLTTMSDEGPLESGGMMQILAFDDTGQPLSLAEGQELTVTMPESTMLEGMELYLSEDGKNWTSTEEEIATSGFDRSTKPVWPTKRIPRFKPPHYKADLKSRPKRPVDPVKPRKPRKPHRVEPPKPKGFLAFRDKDREELNEKIYQKELAKYEADIKKFDRKVERYESRCRDFSLRIDKYMNDIERWEQQEVLRRAEHKDVIVPRLRQAHKETFAEELKIIARLQEDYQKEYARWLETQLENVGANDMVELGHYVFSTSALNWVNCDRLYDVPEEMIADLSISSAPSEQQTICVIENDYRSVLAANQLSETRFSAKVIRNKEPMVFAYKVEDGQLYSFSKVLNGELDVEVEYSPTTFLELRQQMKGKG